VTAWLVIPGLPLIVAIKTYLYGQSLPTSKHMGTVYNNMYECVHYKRAMCFQSVKVITKTAIASLL